MTGSRAVRIMLIEDNPGDIRLVREAFEEGRISNDLQVARNGEEALERLRASAIDDERPRPDVVLLDLSLPGMRGEEVLEEIKSDPDLRTVPVIVMTGSSAAADVARSYDRHANAYLTKPADPDEFLRFVRTFEAFWLEVVTLPPEDGER